VVTASISRPCDGSAIPRLDSPSARSWFHSRAVHAHLRRVPPHQDRFRDPELTLAFDRAIQSADPYERGPLYDRLRRASGLPGARMNTGLVKAFASEPIVDEILPILGVAATGARAATDPGAREKLLEALQEAACDRRHRVRETAADGLAQVGVAVGKLFVDELIKWIDDEQPWVTRAALSSLRDSEWVLALGAEGCARIVKSACDRIAREHRAGRRHEAYRRLLAIVPEVFPTIVVRHPTVLAAVLEIITDRSVRYPTGEDEQVREALEEVATKLEKKGHPDRVLAIRNALKATEKAPRDPRAARPGTRGRGRK
jgi:hypothetical protein